MADRRHSTAVARRVIGTPQSRDALTSAVQPLEMYDQAALTLTVMEPQREAWSYYHSLGEVNYGIGSWLANAISRCTLVAAKRSPGSDDPEIITDGPFAQLVAGLAGGTDGQKTMLKRMAVQISVPGESFLVNEEVAPNVISTRTYSNTELRITGRNPLRYQVNSQQNVWRQLPDESLVSRVWWPDDEIQWRPFSPLMAALPICREIDMYNRFIMATLLSRAASNGVLFVPEEATFPVKPQYKDAPDPFMAELIDVATRSIKNPGSAAAAFPVPVKMSAAMIEKVRWISFATPLGEKVMADRDAALGRLATSLNMPAEVLTGMGDINHWGQWQLEESGVKLHISPVIEVICNGLTETYLKPMAAAGGISLYENDGSEYIIWYDASALIQQPDRTKEAFDLYDRGEITGESLRDTTGFDEDDKPNDDQLKTQSLLKIVMAGGADALAALSALVDDPSIALIPQRVTVTDPTTTPPDQLGDPNAPPEQAPPPTASAPPATPQAAPAPAPVPRK